MNNYKYYCEKCNYGTDIRYSLIQHNETDLHKTGERGKKPIKEKELFKEASVKGYFAYTDNNILQLLSVKMDKIGNRIRRVPML